MKMALRTVFVNVDKRMNANEHDASTEANSEESSEPDVEALVYSMLDENDGKSVGILHLDHDEEATTLAPSTFSTPARTSYQGSPTNLPSLGSVGHDEGTCKRCCFFPKGRCQNGFSCSFCHIEHDKRTRKKHKKSKTSSSSTDKKVTSTSTLLTSKSSTSGGMVGSSPSIDAHGLEMMKAPMQPSRTCFSNEGHLGGFEVAAPITDDIFPRSIAAPTTEDAFLRYTSLNAEALPFVPPDISARPSDMSTLPANMNPEAAPFHPPTFILQAPQVPSTPASKNGTSWCPSPVLTTSSLWAQKESDAPSHLEPAVWTGPQQQSASTVWTRPEQQPAPKLVDPAPIEGHGNSELPAVKDSLPPGWEQTVSADAVLNAMKAIFEKRTIQP